MIPQHHLDDASVLSYSAGAMPEAMAVVATTHLEFCRHCREQLHDADVIGGLLMMQQQWPDKDIASGRLANLRTSILQQLEHEPGHTATHAADADNLDAADASVTDPDLLPAPLHTYFGKRYSELRWRWAGPGMYFIRSARATEGNLIMLKISPGRSLPVHSHGGSELTQILKGAYDDALGHFASGDMADLDSNTLHQPVTCPGVPCICVAALDAPLKFSGWFARKLQPLIGL